MRCPDAVCSKYRRPAGVAFTFQVSEYKVKPAVPNSVFNLLSNDDWRLALADEIKERGPEVALVVNSFF